ncbi:helix-turn-helix domain-containing protein [bacterium]|nr:helix-turn-helix domain-containing protein [bacterium]
MMTDKTDNAPLLLTVREAAMVLRIHRPKVYELIKAGEIDGFKLGADWRIKRDSIEKLTGPIPEDFFEGGAEQQASSG